MLKAIFLYKVLKKSLLFWSVIVKKPGEIFTILKSLVYEIGSQVSYSELSRLIGIDGATVERYIDLLEKNFVVFRLSPFSRNQSRELKKAKIWDVGMRNVIIQDFSALGVRQLEEQGKLWENFVISEIIKHERHSGGRANFYFWHTRDGSEVDLLRMVNGRIYAYEMKLYKRAKLPPSFVNAYKPVAFQNITFENFDELWLVV